LLYIWMVSHIETKKNLSSIIFYSSPKDPWTW
jgi:hypothetical protein